MSLAHLYDSLSSSPLVFQNFSTSLSAACFSVGLASDAHHFGPFASGVFFSPFGSWKCPKVNVLFSLACARSDRPAKGNQREEPAGVSGYVSSKALPRNPRPPRQGGSVSPSLH